MASKKKSQAGSDSKLQSDTVYNYGDVYPAKLCNAKCRRKISKIIEKYIPNYSINDIKYNEVGESDEIIFRNIISVNSKNLSSEDKLYLFYNKGNTKPIIAYNMQGVVINSNELLVDIRKNNKIVPSIGVKNKDLLFFKRNNNPMEESKKFKFYKSLPNNVVWIEREIYNVKTKYINTIPRLKTVDLHKVRNYFKDCSDRTCTQDPSTALGIPTQKLLSFYIPKRKWSLDRYNSTCLQPPNTIKYDPQQKLVTKIFSKIASGHFRLRLSPSQSFPQAHPTTEVNNSRGLLLWHSVGSGKTITALKAAMDANFADVNPLNYRLYWVTRRSLVRKQKDDTRNWDIARNHRIKVKNSIKMANVMSYSKFVNVLGAATAGSMAPQTLDWFMKELIVNKILDEVSDESATSKISPADLYKALDSKDPVKLLLRYSLETADGSYIPVSSDEYDKTPDMTMLFEYDKNDDFKLNEAEKSPKDFYKTTEENRKILGIKDYKSKAERMKEFAKYIDRRSSWNITRIYNAIKSNNKVLGYIQDIQTLAKDVVNKNSCIVIDEAHNLLDMSYYRTISGNAPEATKKSKLAHIQERLKKFAKTDTKILLLTATPDKLPEPSKRIDIVGLKKGSLENTTLRGLMYLLNKTTKDPLSDPCRLIKPYLSYYRANYDINMFPRINNIIAYAPLDETTKTEIKGCKDSFTKCVSQRIHSNIGSINKADRFYSKDTKPIESLQRTRGKVTTKLDIGRYKIFDIMAKEYWENNRRQVIFLNKTYGNAGVWILAKILSKYYDPLIPKKYSTRFRGTKTLGNQFYVDGDKKKLGIAIIGLNYLGCQKKHQSDNKSKNCPTTNIGPVNLLIEEWNKRDSNLGAIIIDSRLKEGIDLKNTNVLHIFDPSPVFTDTEQIIGRVARRCSFRENQDAIKTEKDHVVDVIHYLVDDDTMSRPKTLSGMSLKTVESTSWALSIWEGLIEKNKRIRDLREKYIRHAIDRPFFCKYNNPNVKPVADEIDDVIVKIQSDKVRRYSKRDLIKMCARENKEGWLRGYDSYMYLMDLCSGSKSVDDLKSEYPLKSKHDPKRICGRSGVLELNSKIHQYCKKTYTGTLPVSITTSKLEMTKAKK